MIIDDNFWLVPKFYVLSIVWGLDSNLHISVLNPHCALVTHLWTRPFERSVNMGCIGVLTRKEIGIMLEQKDPSAWWDPTHTSIIEIRWRADLLLLAWHIHAGGCWISAWIGYRAPALGKFILSDALSKANSALSLQPTSFPNLHIKH